MGDCIQSSEAIKIALRSLVQIVKSLNKKILHNAQAETVGFDSALRLSKRTNQLFTSLLESWLVSDTTINYFCFDLCGFAFLLDTVGSDEHSKKVLSNDQTKANLMKVTDKVTSALALSDLDDLLSEPPSSKDFVKSLQKTVRAREHPDWEVLELLQSLAPKLKDSMIESESEETKQGKEDPFKDSGAGEEPRF